MLQVRRGTQADAGPIAAVHVRAWQVAYRGLMPDGLLDGLSVAEREEMWRTLTGEARPVVYVAVQDGVVVGFCAAGPSRDDDAEDGVAEIGAIYVDPDVWRRGVGQELMNVALRDLHDDGWRWVTLVGARREPAGP
jgi:L-amino acid N-acyltransferase YncA